MRLNVAVIAARLISSPAASSHPTRVLRTVAASFPFSHSLSPLSGRLSAPFRRSLSSAVEVESRVSSDGSHSDFAGRSKPSTGSPSSSSDVSVELISRDVSAHPVFLYMKGSPASPKCGFSANVVRILQHLGASFSSRDVLEDPAVREAVKQYSDWPTLPQLYVKGEFVGGSDIISQMFKSGELEKLLTQAGVVQQQAATSTANICGGRSRQQPSPVER